MNHHLVLGLFLCAALVAGCDEQIAGFEPLSAIAAGGFARDSAAAPDAQGRAVKLWGYVDHGNLYADAEAKSILGEWWSGPGVGTDRWRFNLAARAGDDTGRSIPVWVPNDGERDRILRRFVTDARAGRATRIFIEGQLFSFLAPTNVSSLTGLQLRLNSSADIQLDHPRVSGRAERPGLR